MDNRVGRRKWKLSHVCCYLPCTALGNFRRKVATFQPAESLDDRNQTFLLTVQLGSKLGMTLWKKWTLCATLQQLPMFIQCRMSYEMLLFYFDWLAASCEIFARLSGCWIYVPTDSSELLSDGFALDYCTCRCSDSYSMSSLWEQWICCGSWIWLFLERLNGLCRSSCGSGFE